VTLVLPAMGKRQRAGWHALFDIADALPDGWCLVGGQMVYLHCVERNRFPARPTDDVDAVLDVRAHPRMLEEFTGTLIELGFSSDGETRTGHQHRWIRGDATVDILIPRFLGERAERRRGVTGGATIPTIGGQAVLDRAEVVELELDGRDGRIRRPDLLGALSAKAAAYTNQLDGGRDRHLIDFTVLATLIGRGDIDARSLTRNDFQRISNALGNLAFRRDVADDVEDGTEGLERLRLAISRSRFAAE